MVVLTLIERETLQVLLHISQMLNVSIFGNTADAYVIVHLVPYHSISRSTRATVAVSPSGKSGQICARAFP